MCPTFSKERSGKVGPLTRRARHGRPALLDRHLPRERERERESERERGIAMASQSSIVTILGNHYFSKTRLRRVGARGATRGSCPCPTRRAHGSNSKRERRARARHTERERERERESSRERNCPAPPWTTRLCQAPKNANFKMERETSRRIETRGATSVGETSTCAGEEVL